MTRLTVWIAVLLLGIFLALVWTAALRKSEIIDEGLFIGGGAIQVRHANPNVDLTHPPVLRWLAGLPAVFVGRASLPSDPPFVPREATDLYGYKVQEIFDWSVRFFYDAGNRHDWVLFWGRFPFALLGALAAWLIFVEVRRRFGDVPALGALAVFLFTPEILAHAQWAHSDVGSALTLVVVALALARALDHDTLRADLLLGGALGLGILVKLTVILITPLALVLVALLDPPPARGSGTGKTLLRLGRILAATYAVILIGYLPEPRLLPPHEFLFTDLARLIGPHPSLLSLVSLVLRDAPLPDSFLKGLAYTALLGQRGQIGFFHGEVRVTGWWYYFPVALVLKYPTPLLVLALAGLGATVRAPQLSLGRKLAWTLTPLVMFGFAMIQSINIGARAVLSLAPFLALWTGAALAAARGRVTRAGAALLVGLSVASGAAAYPHFLAYFNPLFGGTRAAHFWLADSNYDWGQDLPELARTLERRGIREVRLAYFGGARPSYWGIRTLNPGAVAPGWYAISRTYLSGMWPPGESYAWLRLIPPKELVGGSIALIEVLPSDIARVRQASNAIEVMMRAGLYALYTQHDPADAIIQFGEVLKRMPWHYGATYQLATALDAAGKSAEARLQWAKVLKMAEAYNDMPTVETARARLARGK